MSSREAPVLRFDVTTRDWVLYAPARSHRPREPELAVTPTAASAPCPFCPGNERLTPTELLRLGAGGTDWSVRVVPNRFPALDPALTPTRAELGPTFQQMLGHGAHEVLIESPDHSRPLWLQPREQVERVLRALLAREAALREDSALKAIVIFKNHGERAGTSLRHPHWQLIATPVVPRALRRKHEIAIDYFDQTGRCLYCVVRDEELAAGARVLLVNEYFVAVLPFASSAPFQIRILPREHRASFSLVKDEERPALAEVLREALGRLALVLGEPHFNLTVQSAPLGDEDKPYFLWHLDVLPRLTAPAGFELGSGMSINPVLPEVAAQQLREVAWNSGAPQRERGTE